MTSQSDQVGGDKIRTRHYYMMYPMGAPTYQPFNGLQTYPGAFQGMMQPNPFGPNYGANQNFPGMMMAPGGYQRPMNQQFGQPMNQQFGQPPNQPFNQPFNQPINPPGNQPNSQPNNQPTAQPGSQPISQPQNQPFQQPMQQPTGQQGNQFQNPSQPTNNGNYRRPRPMNNNINLVMVNQPTLPNGQPSYNPLNDPSISQFI